MVMTELPPRPLGQGSRLPPGRRVYAVGDVHGQYGRLLALHKAITQDLRRRPVDEAMLVHLGDVIDRGPDSAGCLSLLAGGPPVDGMPMVNLIGNHEWMMLTALTRQSPEAVGHWLENGGGATLDSWGIPTDMPAGEWPRMIPTAHLEFLRDLALSHQTGPFVFAHAGVRPGIPLARQIPFDLLWIRQDFLGWTGEMLPDSPGTVIVHGHTPEPEPIVFPNRIGVDTGAGRGGPLTCAVLEGGTVRFLQT